MIGLLHVPGFMVGFLVGYLYGACDRVVARFSVVKFTKVLFVVAFNSVLILSNDISMQRLVNLTK